MLRILKTIGMIFGTLIVVLLLSPWVLRGLGYYVDNTGGEIGRLAAEKHDVTLCKKIIVYSHIFGPPTMSRRGECVYTYAELTKDPSACALLMPSSYGLSCVGGAESQSDICSMSNGKVAWHDGSETYASCADLTKKRTSDANACCLIARVAFVKSENDCSSLRDSPAMHDECLQSLAFKNHDPATCEGISNENTKSACLVNAKAIRMDPSICDGCKARVETLDQFE